MLVLVSSLPLSGTARRPKASEEFVPGRCPLLDQQFLDYVHDAVIAGLVIDFEMENVRDLKIYAIDEDQIATDHDVRVIRRRRREHRFEFPRAGLHFFLEAWRQSSTNY